MSFHPLMPYGTEEFQRSERTPLEEGAAFAYTPERAATLEAICGKYPPERRKSAVLAENYADSFIVGPGGFVQSSAIEIGVSVMAPHTTYPDHRHPPEELYLVLSRGEWRQNAEAWHEPGVGGVVYNPPDIVHAMRADAKPLFAIWCLPLDNTPHS